LLLIKGGARSDGSAFPEDDSQGGVFSFDVDTSEWKQAVLVGTTRRPVRHPSASRASHVAAFLGKTIYVLGDKVTHLFDVGMPKRYNPKLLHVS
jgi:hypothetical protein